jgi:hypothetical protein
MQPLIKPGSVKSDRNALFGNVELSNTATVPFAPHKNDLDSKIEEGREVLRDSITTLVRAKDVGNSTLVSLAEQGETLDRLGKKTTETNSLIDVARSTIWRMFKQENRCRLYMAIFIVLLLIGIFSMGYVINQKMQ